MPVVASWHQASSASGALRGVAARYAKGSYFSLCSPLVRRRRRDRVGVTVRPCNFSLPHVLCISRRRSASVSHTRPPSSRGTVTLGLSNHTLQVFSAIRNALSCQAPSSFRDCGPYGGTHISASNRVTNCPLGVLCTVPFSYAVMVSHAQGSRDSAGHRLISSSTRRPSYSRSIRGPHFLEVVRTASSSRLTSLASGSHYGLTSVSPFRP